MNSSANSTTVSYFSDNNILTSPAYYETQIENVAEENEEFNDVSLISTLSQGTPVSENNTTSPISPVIATPTRADLENDFQNYILNFSTPLEAERSTTEGTDLDLTSQSSELSTMGNETMESELGPDSENAVNILKKIRIKNINRITIATLNINSLASKFEQLREVIGNNIDILTIQETKLDSSFPTDQFLIDGYSEPYRKDRNRRGGGVMIYVRSDEVRPGCTGRKYSDFQHNF